MRSRRVLALLDVDPFSAAEIARTDPNGTPPQARKPSPSRSSVSRRETVAVNGRVAGLDHFLEDEAGEGAAFVE